MAGYLFGGNTGVSYQDLQSRREAADALAKRIMGMQPKNVPEGIGALLMGAASGIGRYRTDKALSEGRTAASTQFDSILGRILGGGATESPTSTGSMMPKVDDNGSMRVTSSTPPDVSNNGSTFSPFIDTVKAGGLTNPYGLAAVAATGRAESGWSPKKAGGSWADPSESGQQGTSGGVMSWRADRLQNLRNYAASKGEDGNGSPQTQAEYFMKEDPQLVAKLNSAKSPEEAADLMAGAWRFAGYNRQGGEAARRRGYASAYAPTFAGQGQEVASLDPSAGMAPAAAAIEHQAPASGYVDPTVSAPNFNPTAPNPGSLPTGDTAAMGSQTLPSPTMGAGMQPQAFLPPQQPGNALPPLPSRDVAAAPPVASVPPQQVAQAGPPQMPRAQPYRPDPEMLKLLGNAFLDDGQKAALRIVMQQQMQQAAAAQEEQTWRARQDYEQQQRRSDPAYQANIEQTRAQTQRLREGTRPLTVDERRSWGIPETDTRPYAMAPGGKPELIGASGQTINVGGQIEARKQAAETMGLKPDDPRYMGYVLNGELPKESQQNLTAIDKKAIQDADDMVAANQSALDALSQAEGLSGTANSGWFAGTRASIGNNLPDWMVPDMVSSPESSRATTDMDNAIIGQAVTQLKTIFGGNPTEGERAILLELQGSSTMPRDVRKNVFSRAKALATKRLEFNQNRAKDLRGGDYYKPNRAPATGTNVDDLLKKYGGQ